jgi:hypothetical protein
MQVYVKLKKTMTTMIMRMMMTVTTKCYRCTRVLPCKAFASALTGCRLDFPLGTLCTLLPSVNFSPILSTAPAPRWWSKFTASFIDGISWSIRYKGREEEEHSLQGCCIFPRLTTLCYRLRSVQYDCERWLFKLVIYRRYQCQDYMVSWIGKMWSLETTMNT